MVFDALTSTYRPSSVAEATIFPDSQVWSTVPAAGTGNSVASSGSSMMSLRSGLPSSFRSGRRWARISMKHAYL